MSVNLDLVGKTYLPEGSYVVGREKIREFATALKADNPAHFDVEAARELGYPDLVAPATFAVIVAQQADARYVRDPESGVDFSRVVHAEQRFTHHRPIVATDELTAALTVEQIRPLGGGFMITTSTDISTLGGEKVSTAVSVIVVRGEDQ